MEGQSPKSINFAKLREFIRSPNLNTSEKCVLVDLLLYEGGSGEAFPSQIRLGHDLGLSDRQVRTILNKLKEHGWIEGWRRRGYSKSNLYLLNKELHFSNTSTYRNLTSSQLGNVTPSQTRNSVPANVSQERNQSKVLAPQQIHERIKQLKQDLVERFGVNEEG